MNPLQLKSIGQIKSCYKQKFGTPRQPGRVPHSIAELCLTPEWQPEISLRGLQEFTHLWVMFWFHQNGNYQFHAKVHPPRLKGESAGVFATRSPHRPNPLGLSLVKIMKVLESSVLVSGIDMIDGTPLLDIKPYLPHVEALTDATGGWVEANPESSIEVIWSLEALSSLLTWVQGSKEIERFGLGLEQVKELIVGSIAEDPRPLIYRGFEGGKSPYREDHAIYLFDGDVHFRFLAANRAEVTRILSV